MTKNSRAGVFVIGSINRDFVFKVGRRPRPGETVTDAVLDLHDGGKGANQSAAAALHGASVAFLGCVGDDGLGEPLLDGLSECGVDVSLVRRIEGCATGAAVIAVTPDGENSITVAPGANRRLTIEDVTSAAEKIKDSRVVVAQMEISHEAVEEAASVAREAGARMLLNFAPAREDAPLSLLEGLDPLVVNEHEAAFLTGKEVGEIEDASAASEKLVEMGVKSVVITLGSSGAVCREGRSEAVHHSSPEVEVVDTTGAGDAFVGALAARLAFGDGLSDAVAYAVKAGAAAVTSEGARGALPTGDIGGFDGC